MPLPSCFLLLLLITPKNFYKQKKKSSGNPNDPPGIVNLKYYCTLLICLGIPIIGISWGVAMLLEPYYYCDISTYVPPVGKAPRNLVLFVSDGLGSSSLTLARSYKRQGLNADPIWKGSVRTSSATSWVTDSAGIEMPLQNNLTVIFCWSWNNCICDWIQNQQYNHFGWSFWNNSVANFFGGCHQDGLQNRNCGKKQSYLCKSSCLRFSCNNQKQKKMLSMNDWIFSMLIFFIDCFGIIRV